MYEELASRFSQAFELPDGSSQQSKLEQLGARVRMIREEAREVCEAIDDLIVNREAIQVEEDQQILQVLAETQEILEANLLKEFCDLQFVLSGGVFENFLVEDFHRAYFEVYLNNMSKLGPDGKPIKDVNGKVMKPDGYKSVDLMGILND